MFDWFKKKENRSTNVVPFPEPKVVPPVEPPSEPEKPATIFYRIGTTDQNRVSFQMGYSEITMNRDGIENLIRQLQVFRDQLQEENDGLNSK